MGSSGSLENGKVFGHWQLVLTEDGSPSFSEIKEGVKNEMMHHRGGAFSETLYIYGPAVEGAFQSVVEPRILSVGLGLGYNEILTAATALKSQGSQRFYLQSFEADDFLRESFKSFALGREGALHEIYLDICRRFQVPSVEVMQVLGQALKEGRCFLEGALESPAQVQNLTHIFLWDAFSQKTTPSLWTQEFLIESLKRGNAEGLWFGTYACNANLKSSLKKQNIEIQIRPGFQGKRQCTWGRSGIFNSFEKN